MAKYSYIDLFSGAGGLSLGFDKAGFKNVFSVEFNKSFAQTYKTNFPKHKLILKSICEITNDDIKSLVKNNIVDIVVGGPPCQGFSLAGKIGRRFIDDDRNMLFKEFVRVVSVVQPKIFVLENVAAMATHQKGKTIEEIIKHFEELGYNCNYKVINSSTYGIPQERRRIFLVGTRDGNFNFPKETGEVISIKEVIDDLPMLLNGQSSDIANHSAMKHSDQMLHKMSFIKDGCGRECIPFEIRPKSGDVRKYIRYDSSKPSICITGDMRKVFHYSQNRALTCRELARIQTFPDDFVFEGNSISIQQQIGNAVPPKLAYILASAIKEFLKNE